MDLQTIEILKERAKAKMENKPTQELTDIDIYTAIAEWERETKENKALWKIIYENKLKDLFHKKLERRRIRNSRTFERRIEMEQIVIGIIIGTICGLVGSALGIKKAKKDIEKEEKARTEKNIV